MTVTLFLQTKSPTIHFCIWKFSHCDLPTVSKCMHTRWQWTVLSSLYHLQSDPPSSFSWHTLFQWTQLIFLDSTPPPLRNFLNKEIQVKSNTYANTSYNAMSMLSLVPSLRVIHAYANTNNTIQICLKHATQIFQLPTI